MFIPSRNATALIRPPQGMRWAGGMEEEQVVCPLQKRDTSCHPPPTTQSWSSYRNLGLAFSFRKDREDRCDHHIVYTCCAHGVARGTSWRIGKRWMNEPKPKIFIWEIARGHHLSIIHPLILSSIFSSIYPARHLSIFTSSQPVIYLFIRWFNYPSTHPAMHPSTHPAIHSFTYLVIYVTHIY